MVPVQYAVYNTTITAQYTGYVLKNEELDENKYGSDIQGIY
jgi:hypothetical protein